MSFFTDFPAIAEAAREELMRDPTGELPLFCRKQLWLAMGPLDGPEDDAPFTKGHLRRGQLFVACVEHVLPLWVAAYPEHIGPQIMLKLARKVLDGTLDPDRADKPRDTFWTELDSWDDDEDYEFEPEYVGYGSAKLVTAACCDIIFPDDPLPADEKDWDYDPWSWHTDFFCSLPYKGDTPPEIARLREYWLWYINQAVPEAYASVPE